MMDLVSLLANFGDRYCNNDGLHHQNGTRTRKYIAQFWMLAQIWVYAKDDVVGYADLRNQIKWNIARPSFQSRPGHEPRFHACILGIHVDDAFGVGVRDCLCVTDYLVLVPNHSLYYLGHRRDGALVVEVLAACVVEEEAGKKLHGAAVLTEEMLHSSLKELG